MNAALFTVVCAAAVAALLVAEHLEAARCRAVAKVCASVAFVVTAVVLGALQSSYGTFTLAALCASLLGDVLLLSRRRDAFLAGLAAFLLSHALFAAAFAGAGVSLQVFCWAGVSALPVALVVLRWLWPHLGTHFKVPVATYIAVILCMCTLAAGHAARHGEWQVLLAALLFAASDIAVARDRFVCASFVNRAWGLPTYYAAQLLLAWSVQRWT